MNLNEHLISFSNNLNEFIEDYSKVISFNIDLNTNNIEFKRNILYITGVPGSGKTELSRKLSDKLSIPIISLDDIDLNKFNPSIPLIEAWIRSGESKYSIESFNLLKFSNKYTSPSKVIIEGRQIYEYKLRKDNNSILVLNPDRRVVINNLMHRDKLSVNGAEYLTDTRTRSLNKWLKLSS